jgi:hypothetical protein
MDLGTHVEQLRRHLAVAAEAGGDGNRAVSERLLAALEPSFRLALQDALAAATEEITRELAPGSVELRVRGRDLEFVVRPVPPDVPGDASEPTSAAAPAGSPSRDLPSDADDGTVARINVRMPEHLKTRVEQAAGAEGLSVNAWLVRSASAALDRPDPTRRPERRSGPGGQHFTGWAR